MTNIWYPRERKRSLDHLARGMMEVVRNEPGIAITSVWLDFNSIENIKVNVGFKNCISFVKWNTTNFKSCFAKLVFIISMSPENPTLVHHYSVTLVTALLATKLEGVHIAGSKLRPRKCCDGFTFFRTRQKDKVCGQDREGSGLPWIFPDSFIRRKFMLLRLDYWRTPKSRWWGWRVLYLILRRLEKELTVLSWMLCCELLQRKELIGNILK